MLKTLSRLLLGQYRDFVQGKLTLLVLRLIFGEVVVLDKALTLITLAGDHHSLDLGVENDDETDPGEDGAKDGPESHILNVILGSKLAHVHENALQHRTSHK